MILSIIKDKQHLQKRMVFHLNTSLNQIAESILPFLEEDIDTVDVQELESFDYENLLDSLIRSRLDEEEVTYSELLKERLFDFLYTHDRLRMAMNEKEKEFNEVSEENNTYHQNPLRYHGLRQHDFL